MPGHCRSRLLLLGLLLGLPTACSEGLGEPEGRTLLFTFDEDMQGWSASFTDLATSQVSDVGFLFEHRALPAEVSAPGGALFVSGRNVSDDLFMFLTYPVTDLQPDTPYSLTFELELASNAPTGCAGIGGAPGESVFLKVGGAPVQPERITDASGHYRLNVDKGEQSVGGNNARVVGTLANGSTDCAMPAYRRITRDNLGSPLPLTSDSAGRLFLLVGTDSGFEGTSALYFDTIRAVLKPLQP
jgi:hypothetical protein